LIETTAEYTHPNGMIFPQEFGWLKMPVCNRLALSDKPERA